MAVATRKIPRLGGEDHFILRKCPHIDSLVGTRARREEDCPRIEQNLDQAFAQRRAVHAARRRNNLKAHARMNSLALEKLRELANVLQSPAGAAPHLRHLNRHPCDIPDRFHISHRRRARNLWLDLADVYLVYV